MDREFIDLYNRELSLFYEHAQEFADEYPDIAQRLGGLLRDRADPMAAGLLEGAAFLAARVQLKLKHEFPEFTHNLLEQLAPHYLAPTPSALLAQVTPRYGDTALFDGPGFPRGATLDAAYKEANRSITCRYKLTAPLQLWPIYVKSAEYLTSASALQPLRIAAPPRTVAGLKLTLAIAATANPFDAAAEEAAPRTPDVSFAKLKARELPIYLAGAEGDASALYEQIFGHCTGIWLRYVDAEDGLAKGVEASSDCLSQIGFREDTALLPNDERIFLGFDLIRDYFLFAQKFLGFTLAFEEAALKALPTREIDVVLGFDELNSTLAAAVTRDMFALYAAPAINLFEMSTDRVVVKRSQHEYHIVPDKSRYLDYEPHRILDVYAHYSGGAQKRRVRPLYAATGDAQDKGGLRYAIRRMMRRRTIEEKRFGEASSYVGSDMYISLTSARTLSDTDDGPAELSVRALCSNRHLAEHLPVGAGRSDFRFADDMELSVVCRAGPTRPREPIVAHMRSRTESAHAGVVAWRLINMLSLNHLGLVERGAAKNAQALREILATFADPNDAAADRRIRAVMSVDSRPVVRRIRCAGGVGPGRGVEISVTLDGKSFEGGGAFLLGAVLDRFYAEYAAFNHFTQLVVKCAERGEIMRWPVRAGARRPL